MKLRTPQEQSYFRLLLAESLINSVAGRYCKDPLVAEFEADLKDMGQKLNLMMDGFEGGRNSELCHVDAQRIDQAQTRIMQIIDGRA